MDEAQLQEVVLAEPRGLLRRRRPAIEIVERALRKFGAPIYVRHDDRAQHLRRQRPARGAIFIEDLADVPVAPRWCSARTAWPRRCATRLRRGFPHLRCHPPAGHQGARRGRQAGQGRLRVHHDRPQGHPEVEGTMGQLREGIYLVEDADDVARVQPARTKLAVVTQTTLSVDDAAEILAAVKRALPARARPKKQDICYATQNRQDAVKVLAPGWTWSSSSAAPPAATATACASWPNAWARWPTWSTRPATRCPSGSRAGARGPPPAPRRRTSWCSRSSNACGRWRLSSARWRRRKESVQFPLPLGLGDRSMAELDAARS